MSSLTISMKKDIAHYYAEDVGEALAHVYDEPPALFDPIREPADSLDEALKRGSAQPSREPQPLVAGGFAGDYADGREPDTSARDSSAQPPGMKLRSLIDLVYPKSTAEHIFHPHLADMEHEWRKAVREGDTRKARRVVFFGRGKVAVMMLANLAEWVARLNGIFRMGG